MELSEIFKSQGISDEQINNILSALEKHGIYITTTKDADNIIKKFEGGLTKKEVDNLKGEHKKELEAQKLNIMKKIAVKNKFSEIKDKGFRKYLEEGADLENMTIDDDGNSKELDEYYEKIKEENPKYFGTEIPENTGSLGNFAKNTEGKTESVGERLAKQATESNQFNQHNYFGGDK
ncbi:hypothetical protein WS9_013390 [Paraclostridium sordellii 8483]|uniref:hypothetical protein n=1 Tax=Paraclostridium sordellii TaxID=1505 RepID=UPI000319932F|nr:hypothetical protein [Paeniclostridium sordellii]TAN64782.1 hypothetical protein WS9_013390 [Paeniclostridium sordellii 8483]